MKIGTVIAALLLGFLLFTPQGQFIAEAVMLKAMTPAPDPAKVAAEKACIEAFNAKQAAAWKKAKEVAKGLPGFEYSLVDQYAMPHC